MGISSCQSGFTSNELQNNGLERTAGNGTSILGPVHSLGKLVEAPNIWPQLCPVVAVTVIWEMKQ